MRIARLPGGKSRREKRRERERAQARRLGLLERAEAEEATRIKPARRKGPAAPPPVDLPLSDLLSRRRTSSMPLPSQERLIATNIRLRHHVDIILGTDLWAEEIEVRHSLIEDIDEQGRLYLAQTAPPILRSQVGQLVELTFLSRYFDVPGGRWLRVGYATPIREVIPDYRVSQHLTEPVIVVDGPKKLVPVSVRTAFRVVPPDDLDLRLVIWPEGTPLGLMDISMGGAQVYHDLGWYFSKGRRLLLMLISGELKLMLTGKVVRTDKVRDRLGWERRVTSFQFVEMDPKTKHKLSQLLTEVYRHVLAQRSGIAPRE